MYNRGSRKRDGKQGKKQEGWKNAEIGKTVGELHKNEADNQRKKSRKKLDKGEEDKDKERGQKQGRKERRLITKKVARDNLGKESY